MKDLAMRRLERSDLDAVAKVHVAAFRDGAITRMGADVAYRYYAWQLDGPHDCYAVGAFQGRTLLAFCFGGTFRGALSGFIRANRFFLLRRLFLRPQLLADANVRDRIKLAVRYLYAWRRRRLPTPRKMPAEPKHVLQEPSFGILAIAVDPAWQHGGVGRTLLADAEAEALRRGFKRMHLTVNPENEQAIRFYERKGWERLKDAGGEWQGKMTYRL